MNPLQPSGYRTCRQGQKLASVFTTYLICVFRTLLHHIVTNRIPLHLQNVAWELE